MVEQFLVCQHCGKQIGFAESDLSVYALMQLKCNDCRDKKWLWGIRDLTENEEWFRITNLKFITDDKIVERYGNPHEWDCMIDIKEKTIKVIDTV